MFGAHFDCNSHLVSSVTNVYLDLLPEELLWCIEDSAYNNTFYHGKVFVYETRILSALRRRHGIIIESLILMPAHVKFHTREFYIDTGIINHWVDIFLYVDQRLRFVA